MKRICIYPKDIQLITGKSERQCRYIITKIKKKGNKQKHQPVTLDELSDYLGLPPGNLQSFLK